jgi:hypothetical protein
MLRQALRRSRPQQSLTIDAGPHKQQPTDGPAGASGIADFEPIHQHDTPIPDRSAGAPKGSSLPGVETEARFVLTGT